MAGLELTGGIGLLKGFDLGCVGLLVLVSGLGFHL